MRITANAGTVRIDHQVPSENSFSLENMEVDQYYVRNYCHYFISELYRVKEKSDYKKATQKDAPKFDVLFLKSSEAF